MKYARVNPSLKDELNENVRAWAQNCIFCSVYHGTNLEALPSILEQGLVPRSSTETYGKRYQGSRIYAVPGMSTRKDDTDDRTAWDEEYEPQSDLHLDDWAAWYWALMGWRFSHNLSMKDALTVDALKQLCVVAFRLEPEDAWDMDPYYEGYGIRFENPIPLDRINFIAVIANPAEVLKELKRVLGKSRSDAAEQKLQVAFFKAEPIIQRKIIWKAEN